MAGKHDGRDCFVAKCFFLLILLAGVSSADGKVAPADLRVPNADETQIISLRDGSVLTGRITKVQGDTVMFSSGVGEVALPTGHIDNIKTVRSDSFKEGKLWFPNPNRTRLYFAPTGRMLEAGKGYVSDMLFFFPSVSYGITDNISIAGGGSLFPGVDIDEQLYYLFPRLGFVPTEKLSVAASALIVRIPKYDEDLIDESKLAGILFGTATYGSEDLSLTGGVGYGYVGNDFADKPALLIGGEWRFARRLSFVSENWVFPEVDNPLVSYGIRFFGESLSADVGFFTPTGEESIFPGVPLVSFTWNY